VPLKHGGWCCRNRAALGVLNQLSKLKATSPRMSISNGSLKQGGLEEIKKLKILGKPNQKSIGNII
jgi:hypothetical protein